MCRQAPRSLPRTRSSTWTARNMRSRRQAHGLPRTCAQATATPVRRASRRKSSTTARPLRRRVASSSSRQKAVRCSCLGARTACPPTDPAPDSNCTANGLSCTLTTYTCPGTSTVITTEWAECLQSTWRVGVAGFVCPDPLAANNAALVGGVVGGCAALAIAAGVATYWLRGKNSATKKTVLTKGVDGASRA